MRLSEGFSRLAPSVVGITAAVVSFVMLALALRWLPVGTAYAVWVGIGAALTAVWAMVSGRERASVLRILLIAGLVACVVGLKVLS